MAGPTVWLMAVQDIARICSSVFNRFNSNLVYPLDWSIDDRPPNLKKLGQL